MKYQGVVELSVREYLGIEDGATAWQVKKNVIGIKIDGEVYDYKTLEKYNFLDRKQTGDIDLGENKLIVGKIYAVPTIRQFGSEQVSNDHQIQAYIENKNYFSREYVEEKPKIKQLIKAKKQEGKNK